MQDAACRHSEQQQQRASNVSSKVQPEQATLKARRWTAAAGQTDHDGYVLHLLRATRQSHDRDVSQAPRSAQVQTAAEAAASPPAEAAAAGKSQHTQRVL